MTTTLLIGPTAEPVTLTEAKAHLRVDSSAEDTLIQSLIMASRLHIEAALDLALITQTWRFQLDRWPRARSLNLPLRPVQSLTAVKVFTSDDESEVLDNAAFILDGTANPARLILSGRASLPLPGRAANGIEIGFVAGYLMYGAIFLALGSLCESLQEAQTLLGPVALVLAMPMMLITPALDNPNAPIVEVASWVPLFTPFLLLIRAPTGLPWIEIAGQGAIMIVAVVIVLMLAARVFKAGVIDQVSMANLRGRKKG